MSPQEANVPQLLFLNSCARLLDFSIVLYSRCYYDPFQR
jgi:hypothetical protein